MIEEPGIKPPEPTDVNERVWLVEEELRRLDPALEVSAPSYFHTLVALISHASGVWMLTNGRPPTRAPESPLERALLCYHGAVGVDDLLGHHGFSVWLAGYSRTKSGVLEQMGVKR